MQTTSPNPPDKEEPFLPRVETQGHPDLALVKNDFTLVMSVYYEQVYTETKGRAVLPSSVSLPIGMGNRGRAGVW